MSAGPVLDIKLKRANKVYHEGDVLSGFVVIQSKGETHHQGVTLHLEGSITLNTSGKSSGVLDALTSSLKPITIISQTVLIEKDGRLPAGRTERPFEIPVKSSKGRTMYETYHGVFVNIQYSLTCEMKRSMLSKNVVKTLEFILEYPTGGGDQAFAKPTDFLITPASIQHVKDKSVSRCEFKLSGRLASTCCCLGQPFRGRLSVDECDKSIKSVELQLVRVETCGCAEGFSQEKTEIQNIQIAEGDVCRGLVVPIYMVFPRLFACPTVQATNFKIEFEINIVVIFTDEKMLTENFPIKLTRF